MVTTSTLDAERQGVRIARLRAYRTRIPLRKPIVHASHARTESENVVVECQLGNGLVGFGEGVPRDYVTGEDIATSLNLLEQNDWDSLVAELASNTQPLETIRRFELPSVPGDARRCIGNAARCAVELALLDALGKSTGQSVFDLLQTIPEYKPLFEPRDWCRYSGAITSKPSFKREVISAFKMRFAWFKDVKVKVGTAGQDDVRRLRAFRRILGPRARIRIDANEAWSPGEAAERILALEPSRIVAVEQPVLHENFDVLPSIRRLVHTPIMLDESLCSRADAERALESRACDLFNIRLSKCGGLFPSLDLALLAKQNGLGYQLGCQVGETGLLSAAGRHFACLVKGLLAVEGSYDQYLVRERLTKSNISFEWRGIAPRLRDPGLGVEVDPARLARVTAEEIPLYG